MVTISGPGSGASFGNAIVEHPKTRFIAFTGSRDVGLEIHERAAKHQKGQIWIKRTILEMGGKDSTVVMADSDLDAAVDGVVAAAFGFSGQKCSACSRAIVDAPVYDVFVERVREKVATLKVGDPAGNPNMGPVINKAAMDSILNYVEIGKKEGRLVAGGKAVANDEGGFFIEPTVIADVAPDAVIAQEEIFGPVLSVFKWSDTKDVIDQANAVPFGLTANVWTNNLSVAHTVAAELEAGYVWVNGRGNRPAGAPFGGFGLSGLGKENSLDELLSYTRTKSVDVSL